MNLRLFSILLGTGSLVCVDVPGFATAVTQTRAAQPVGTVRQSETPGAGYPVLGARVAPTRRLLVHPPSDARQISRHSTLSV